MVQRFGLTILLASFCLAGAFILLHRLSIRHPNQKSEGDVELHLSREQKREAETRRSTEGRVLFVDPGGKFSFQYESDGHSYTIEQGSIPGIYSVCDALNCSSVGVEIGPLELVDGNPLYNYRRLTYDRATPDVLEELEWNGYPAYKATFAWRGWPERYLFIHIPKDGQLLTIYRDVTDDSVLYRQFDVISETLRFME